MCGACVRRRWHRPLPAMLLALSAACSAPDPGASADAAVPYVSRWDPGLPASALLQSPALRARGLRTVRGIIHLHSPYSHDACDGDPQPGGMLNAPCLSHLRRGLCATRMDFAMLTDHATHMTEAEPFEKLLLAAPGDALLRAGDAGAGPYASRWRCPAEAGEVLVTVGGENELMPVGLQRHLGATPAARAASMHAESAQAVKDFHAAGAVVLVAHGESRTLPLLRTLADGGLDGMEVYNLHANIDPKIRENHLGLDAFGAITGLAPWLAGRLVEEGGPEPDLAVLGFLSENASQLGKYDVLLAEGRHLSAVMGSDIHENTVPQLLVDEERGDSYRRLMRWFSNHLLVAQPQVAALDHPLVQEALRAGRSYGVFEVFGSPQGFDFHGEQGGAVFELGATMPASGAVLRLTPPRLLYSATLPRPAGGMAATLRVRVLRVPPLMQPLPESPEPSEQVVNVTLSADSTPEELVLRDLKPGAYRVEVRIVPHHLLPLLGANPEVYRREYPYLYASPIYVQAR